MILSSSGISDVTRWGVGGGVRTLLVIGLFSRVITSGVFFGADGWFRYAWGLVTSAGIHLVMMGGSVSEAP